MSLSDTVNVYLHQSVSPFNTVDSTSTVLDSVTLKGMCFFSNAPTGKYYIEVRHRNALETWSRPGGDSLKKGGVTVYDFTTDSTKAFGDNQTLVGTKYCLFSGDVVKDGSIDASDLIAVYNDAFNFATGYINTDVTGDMIADSDDITIVYNNSLQFVAVIRP